MWLAVADANSALTDSSEFQCFVDNGATVVGFDTFVAVSDELNHYLVEEIIVTEIFYFFFQLFSHLLIKMVFIGVLKISENNRDYKKMIKICS